MEVGLKGKKEIVVTEELTALKVGSGLLPVYATPQMIALMENTASSSVLEYLEEGMGTVGTKIEVAHTAATPVGMQVTCESELIEIDRKRLTFRVTCFDEAGQIGEGIHERFIIENEKFLKKTNAKLEKK